MTTLGARRVTADDVSRFLASLGGRDRRGAMDQVDALLAAGVSTSGVVSELLGPVQHEVGRLWESGEWSVAQEHLASATIDAVLQTLSYRAAALPTRPAVAVACVEGEYHALPARMLTEILRAAGFDVAFLGASLPADAVGSLVEDVAPLALALSCSLTAHLLEAEAAIAVAHSCGVPVLVGGAAFGHDRRRADVLGADGWAGDGAGAVAVLDAWSRSVPPFNSAERLFGDHLGVRAMRADLVAAVVAEVTRGSSPGEAGSAGLRGVADSVGSLVDNLAAAVKLDEPALLAEVVGWSATHGGEGVARAAVAALRSALPEQLGVARRFLEDANRLALGAAA